MKRILACVMVLVGVLFITSGCEDESSCRVRFQNTSSSKTVCPIWDGGKAATLAPGETSEYQNATPGTHTIQWKDTSNRNLTSIGWPNLVDGQSYTFPY